MPSTSWKQHKFMEAIKHSPSFAHKAGVSQKVGQDFSDADDAAGITKSHTEGQKHVGYAHGGMVGNHSMKYHKEPDADDWNKKYSQGGTVYDQLDEDNNRYLDYSPQENQEDNQRKIMHDYLQKEKPAPRNPNYWEVPSPLGSGWVKPA